jgi:hypothetical protein
MLRRYWICRIRPNPLIAVISSRITLTVETKAKSTGVRPRASRTRIASCSAAASPRAASDHDTCPAKLRSCGRPSVT